MLTESKLLQTMDEFKEYTRLIKKVPDLFASKITYDKTYFEQTLTNMHTFSFDSEKAIKEFP